MTKSRSPRIWFSSLARMSWKTSSASMCYETCAQSWIRMSRRRLLAAAAAATGGGGAMWQRWDQNHYLVSCSYWVLYNYMYTKKDDPAIVHLGLLYCSLNVPFALHPFSKYFPAAEERLADTFLPSSFARLQLEADRDAAFLPI